VKQLICTDCGFVQPFSDPMVDCRRCGAGEKKLKEFTIEETPQTLEEVRGRAREKLRKICGVFPYCDGDRDRLCQHEAYGRPIGMGGVGLGLGFAANIKALAKVQLRTSVVGGHFEPDTSLVFAGQEISMPIMGASTSGVSAYNNAITEDDFCLATLQGCQDAETMAWRGDTYFYTEQDNPALDGLNAVGGHGISIFKPRAQDVLKRLFERAQQAGCPAVGVDLDGCGSTNFARAGQPVFRKTAEELQELVKCTSVPFIAKGIMTVADAQACVAAGVKILVVSNHGGRVLDSTPGVADVLPLIRAKTSRQVVIVADGGVRTGYDVLKFIALGANAVLIGRDIIRAAIGGGRQGVSLQMKHLQSVLKRAMLLTGCPNLAAIRPSILYRPSQAIEE
jgi:4-hydroxymandelate oxidase